MPSFAPTAVSVQASRRANGNDQAGYHSHNGYQQSFYNSNQINGSINNNLLGSGVLGPDVMQRIFMSFRSGIELEIKWALSTICLLSLNLPNLINFEKFPMLGNELIKYFILPYEHVLGDSAGNPSVSNTHTTTLFADTNQALNISIDALLTLRNASQDLINQQWLSQVKNFKKMVLKVLKLLVNITVDGKNITGQTLSNIDQYHESLSFLLDLVETLSCYYIDNNKNDPLFHLFLVLLSKTNDKAIVISCLKCIGNLLIVRSPNKKPAENEEVKLTYNCIESFPLPLLQQIVEYLLINDQELNFTVVQFIKQYLSSQAINPQYPTIESSQQYRLKQLCNNKSIFKILVKQLPQLMIQSIPLNEPQQLLDLGPNQLILSKRTLGTSVPSEIPVLNDQLFDIIVKFHEPLRASTWLRCCYEPVYQSIPYDSSNSNSLTIIPGEVTQISLWKAYDKQFGHPRGNESDKPNNYPKLLPAVDFIKNVSAAFPHSEAKVENVTDPITNMPSRRFVIKGIQPRQFVVNIDVGNYDALKQKPSTQQLEMDLQSTDFNLPIGHIDRNIFNNNFEILNSRVLQNQLDKNQLSILNLLSLELMNHIISNVIEDDEEAKGIFRFENAWLRDYIFVNPSLIDSSILSFKWLEYLI